MKLDEIDSTWFCKKKESEEVRTHHEMRKEIDDDVEEEETEKVLIYLDHTNFMLSIDG